MAAGLEIHDAASTGDYDSLEEYLKSGKFDVNLKDGEWGNRTALHWACAKGFVECIRLLLDYGGSGTARTDEGWTPAHFAAETGKLTALRALHNANIPIGLKDKYGDPPRRIAEMYGHTECVKFLEQCAKDEAAGIRPHGISPKFTSVIRHRRSNRLSIGLSSKQSSRPSSPVSSAGSRPSSPFSFLDRTEEEQRQRGINNDEEYTPDPERET